MSPNSSTSSGCDMKEWNERKISTEEISVSDLFKQNKSSHKFFIQLIYFKIGKLQSVDDNLFLPLSVWGFFLWVVEIRRDEYALTRNRRNVNEPFNVNKTLFRSRQTCARFSRMSSAIFLLFKKKQKRRKKVSISIYRMRQAAALANSRALRVCVHSSEEGEGGIGVWVGMQITHGLWWIFPF
jgi:hypothetical protein